MHSLFAKPTTHRFFSPLLGPSCNFSSLRILFFFFASAEKLLSTSSDALFAISRHFTALSCLRYPPSFTPHATLAPTNSHRTQPRLVTLTASTNHLATCTSPYKYYLQPASHCAANRPPTSHHLPHLRNGRFATRHHPAPCCHSFTHSRTPSSAATSPNCLPFPTPPARLRAFALRHTSLSQPDTSHAAGDFGTCARPKSWCIDSLTFVRFRCRPLILLPRPLRDRQSLYCRCDYCCTTSLVDELVATYTEYPRLSQPVPAQAFFCLAHAHLSHNITSFAIARLPH